VQFLDVGLGRTACGELGEGRLAEPEDIVAAVEAALARPSRRLRVLVTSGGTSEPIDGVRVLTNTSTGATGAGIASHVARCGHEVVLLRAALSVAASAAVRDETFVTFADLDAGLTRLLGSEDFDAVIHAAAVGDFSVGSVTVDGVVQTAGTKLDSARPLQLTLQPQPKLLDQLRRRSLRPDLTVVAFKLTTGTSTTDATAAIAGLFAHGAADYVVHNDLAARGEAPGAFPADIHPARGGAVVHCATRSDLAARLEEILRQIHSTP
jgi:phosphopantothenoylcysteine synthetase/decarboxylase